MTEKEYVNQSERLIARINDTAARVKRYEELAASPGEAPVKASHEAQAAMARRQLEWLEKELRSLDERFAAQSSK